MSNENQDKYVVPRETVKAEIKVKGSRFIATVQRARTKEEAEAIYLRLRKEYYNATHNCFAFRIDQNSFRYSDDGEPSGTAGKPIYQALEKIDILQTLCVVTRYYGGTKLGTGGLIRAYSDAAQLALDGLPLKTRIRTGQLVLKFSYDLENLIRRELTAYKGKIVSSNYADKIEMKLALPLSKTDAFSQILVEKTNDSVQITRI